MPAKKRQPHRSSANVARVVLACGATGAGKTLWVRRQVAAQPGVLVWDAKMEYPREDRSYKSVTTVPALIGAVRKGPAKLAYTGPLKDFADWCKVAHAAADIWGGAAVVVEELADVTSPGKAPDDWGIIVRRGRDRAMQVYATTQRPSESDKTIIGNLTLWHVGRMPRLKDARYVQEETGIPAEKIQRFEDRHYCECDSRGVLSYGVVKIK